MDKGHGRIEIRKIAVSSEVAAHLDWPGAAQVVRIERHRHIAKRMQAGAIQWRDSVEIAYLVTSLSAAEASPEHLLALNRAHWGIENRLHHVRDVSLGEDRCRVRAGARPLAALRNLAVSLLRKSGVPIPEARENFREDRAEAIKTVTGRIL